MVTVRFFGKSDAGLVRENNEDAFLVNPELSFAALADGMGGAAAGELASSFFVGSALETFAQKGQGAADDCMVLLKASFDLANKRILDHAAEKPEDKGLGCTAELLTFFDNSFALAHIGDSRTYLFRGNVLNRLTQDHSLVQELVNRGAIKPEEARTHKMRHVILRAVGHEQVLELQFNQGEVFPGDLFLLCSDGLTDMIDDEEIRDILSLPLEIDECAQKLIDAAKEKGGHDNVTVVLCEIVEGGADCSPEDVKTVVDMRAYKI